MTVVSWVLLISPPDGHAVVRLRRSDGILTAANQPCADLFSLKWHHRSYRQAPTVTQRVSESDCWSDLSLHFGCIKKKKSRVYSVFSSMESSRDLSSIADVFCGPKTHFLQQVTSFPAASKHQNPETKPPAAHLRVHILLKLPRWRSELSLRGCTRNPKHVFIPALPYTPHNKHTLSHVRLPPADRNKCTHSFPNRPRSLQQ